MGYPRDRPALKPVEEVTMDESAESLPGLEPKLYYSIREVAGYTGVKAHVLRYWEQEFPSLRPKKNRAGNRSYRPRDIQEILRIRKLLYDDGFKIDGARKLLRESEGKVEQISLLGESTADTERRAKFAELRRETGELLEFVRGLRKRRS
jgi:DNA-binding transcriptional MerR regulator